MICRLDIWTSSADLKIEACDTAGNSAMAATSITMEQMCILTKGRFMIRVLSGFHPLYGNCPMQVATALSRSNIKPCTQDAGPLRQADSVPCQDKRCCYRRYQAFVRDGIERSTIREKTRFMVAPAAATLITTIGSLSYYLVTRYLPSGNVLLAVTDLLLLALSLGVLALSIKSFFRPQPAGSPPVSPYSFDFN